MSFCTVTFCINEFRCRNDLLIIYKNIHKVKMNFIIFILKGEFNSRRCILTQLVCMLRCLLRRRRWRRRQRPIINCTHLIVGSKLETNLIARYWRQINTFVHWKIYCLRFNENHMCENWKRHATLQNREFWKWNGNIHTAYLIFLRSIAGRASFPIAGRTWYNGYW